MATHHGDYTPAKSTLLLLFAAACRRLENSAESLARMPASRITSATESVHQRADDIRDAVERSGTDAADPLRGPKKTRERQAPICPGF